MRKVFELLLVAGTIISLSAGPAAANVRPDYFLPWDQGVSRLVTQGNNGQVNGSNTGDHQFNGQQYAWDFGGGGWTIRAPRAGTIVAFRDTETNSLCGVSGTPTNFVRLDHGDGTESFYAHLATGSVSGFGIHVGQTVPKYTPLAITGNIGNSCGAHLHYQVQTPCTNSNGFCTSVASSFLDPNVLSQDPNGVPQSLSSTSQYVISGNQPVQSGTTVGDYNGDRKTDLATWRPGNQTWYTNGALPVTQYGQNGDIPVPSDYNGDGKTDIALWRPGTANWYTNGALPVTQYGQNGDIPVPGDYNGDGKIDLALWRPSTGTWYTSGALPVTQYGQAGDIPVPGDYNGDGKTDIALWRPSNGTWYFNGVLPVTQYGQAGDIPVPADYNGDGKTDIALWRPSTATWYTNGALPVTQYGASSDIPQPGDYNGDHKIDLALWRPSTGTWYTSGALPVTQYGQNGDIPVSSLVLNRAVLQQLGLA
jgi:putative transposon-encoded protein